MKQASPVIKRIIMSTVRYSIKEDKNIEVFVIRDEQKEGAIVCWCSLKKNAELVARVLNKVVKDIEDADAACELGG